MSRVAGLTRRTRGGGRTFGPPSLREQQDIVRTLEEEARVFGARQIPQDSPGVFSRLLDVLSRGNFAMAGIAEEALEVAQGRDTGPTAARDIVTRPLRELLSGVGGLKGDKRGFGQVLERAGVGTVSIADIFPAMDGTLVGRLGLRGAVGLTLDIATDPLTYITFGGNAAGRTLVQIGKRSEMLRLSPVGEAARNAFRVSQEGRRAGFVREFLEKSKLPAEADRLGAANQAFEESVMTRFVQDLGDTAAVKRLRKSKLKPSEEAELVSRGFGLPKELLDPRGIQFGVGRNKVVLVSGEQLRTYVKEPTRKALAALPGGEAAMAGAVHFGESVSAHMARLFSSGGMLRSLPTGAKAKLIREGRDFANQTGHIRARRSLMTIEGNDALGIKPDLAQRTLDARKKFAKMSPARDFDKEAYDIAKGVRQHVMDPADREIVEEWKRFYESMGEDLVRMEVLPSSKFRSDYGFPQIYDEASQDALRLYHGAKIGKAGQVGGIEQDFFKSRFFENHEEAVQRSMGMNTATRLADDVKEAGTHVEVYPILKPVFNLLDAADQYVDKYATAIGRKAYQDRILQLFGKRVSDSVDPKKIFDISRRIEIDPGEAGIISDFLGKQQHLRNLEEKIFTSLNSEWTGKIPERITSTVNETLRLLPKLTDDGKRELIRQLYTKATNAWHFSELANELMARGFGEFLPDLRLTVNTGEVINGLRYTQAIGGLFGKGAALPDVMIKEISGLNGGAFTNPEVQRFLAEMIPGFDKANSLFRTGVYTYWPASAFRDKISNIYFNLLDIGWRAVDPQVNSQAIKVVAIATAKGEAKKKLLARFGDDVWTTRAGVSHRIADLAETAQARGIHVPGELFLERTGKEAQPAAIEKLLTRGRVRRFGKGVMTARSALVDNYDRIVNFMGNVDRGLPMQDAIDRVGEFLFQYNELTGFEREFARRLIPFYTFTRKNVELHARQLQRNPGAIINQLKPFRQRDDEKEMMVKWEGEALSMRIDRDGKTVRVITGIDLPLRNLDNLWAGGAGATGRRLISMLSPLIKAPIQLATGRDLFLDRALDRTRSDFIGRIIDNTPMAKGVKDWLGYKKDVDFKGRTRYTFDGTRFDMLFRSWMVSRVISTGDRVFKNYIGDDPRIAAAVLDFMTGLRRKDLNLDDQLQQRYFNRIEQLQRVLVQRGRRKYYVNAFTPASVRDQEAQFE